MNLLKRKPILKFDFTSIILGALICFCVGLLIMVLLSIIDSEANQKLCMAKNGVPILERGIMKHCVKLDAFIKYK